ncbi:MAG: cyclodeaminase/cyclohydrolase family protein [Eubacteriaceae bacterium]|jgi:formiminotetrahydrofolate cyclodeaminase|nr:cyclodeaminase/cyclohydrolase family protein [Eubacteriaceae bacterium]
MNNVSVEKFLNSVASDDAVPGGGSVSALLGALGASLTVMVADLTNGKPGYETVYSEMKTLENEAVKLQKELSEDIINDASAFESVMNAFKMQKGTDDQKRIRNNAIQTAYKTAAEVPLDAAKKCCHVLKIAQIMVKKGNVNACSDGLVAAMCARSGGIGALYNVWINLEMIKDEQYVEMMKQDVYSIGNDLVKLEHSVLNSYSLVFQNAERQSL